MPVLVAVFRLAEASATNARTCRGGDTELLGLELPVVVAIYHVAGHMRIPPIHVRTNGLMRDELCRIGKDGSALDVIPVAVAVNDVPDRHLEAFRKLLFQPGRKRSVERIREDDAVGRHQKDAVPGAAACTVEIA